MIDQVHAISRQLLIHAWNQIWSHLGKENHPQNPLQFFTKTRHVLDETGEPSGERCWMMVGLILDD